MAYLCPVAAMNGGRPNPQTGKYDYYAIDCDTGTNPQLKSYDHAVDPKCCYYGDPKIPDYCYALAPALRPAPAEPAPAAPAAPAPEQPAPAAPAAPRAADGPAVALDWNAGYPGAGTNVRVLYSVDCKLKLVTHKSRIVRLFCVAFKVPTKPVLIIHQGYEIGGFCPGSGGDSLPIITSINEMAHPKHQVFFDGEMFTVLVLDVL
jgi:hypothetical protein